MIDEFKGVVAQSCSEYKSSSGLVSAMSISIYGPNCNNCSNFKNNRCTKNLLDGLAKTINNN